MGKFDRVILSTPDGNHLGRFSTVHFVQTSPLTFYYIFVLSAGVDLLYKKSIDGGRNWNKEVIIDTKNCYSFSVWFDGWSGITATSLIHIAYIDNTSHDVFYINIDTSSDTLSSVYTIFTGASSANDGTLSITRTRGGNLICGGCIDAGAEPFFKKSTDVGVNWSNITIAYEATTDQLILLPGWAVDNQDAMCFYWDASADEISRKLYDDSADSWSESSIAGSMVDLLASGFAFPNFSAAVDITNSQNILVAWSATDTANADLRCWKITEGAITEMTNVVLNSGDDQGNCGISIDITTNYWYVFYYGKSDGSETWLTAVNIYYKVSQDAGTTWGAETAITTDGNYVYGSLITCPRFYNKMICYFLVIPGYLAFDAYSKELVTSHSTYQLGM